MLASHTERSRLLLHTARFATLASVSVEGDPWASVVNFVTISPPIRIIWYSLKEALHSRNLLHRPDVSGAIYRADLGDVSPLGLDGAQFTGKCRVIPDDEAEDIHRQYYCLNFPDATVRHAWMLPLDSFVGEGSRRFYEVAIEAWWLFDIDGWLKDKCDRRIPVAIETI
ncbi:pyridoxamine 5'-phosphate oxidase family protein [Burkholderia cepacia]|uniref:pyridoxamine 5'-phosphate oxidase family protein n=1 Tax=Burkholderia cepacia TaxID=292 RepID=UPI00065138C3|nr:pyridoxamine 5'-phosphate oxidase family protein [Burkholderia cepacia]